MPARNQPNNPIRCVIDGSAETLRATAARWAGLERSMNRKHLMTRNSGFPRRQRSGLTLRGLSAVLCLGLIAWTSTKYLSLASAQDADESIPSAAPSGDEVTEGAKRQTLWDMFLAGGMIGHSIVCLSVVGMGFAIEHALTIRKEKLMPTELVAEVEELIRNGRIDDALAVCQLPENDSLFASVVSAGLERYRASEFGFAEYRTAVEEAGEEQTNKLYRKTEVLSIVASVAPMLGLLGTVQGMIIAFNLIAESGGTAKPYELAGGISLALVTTFEGLVVAIPCMMVLSWFRNQIDSLVNETGKRVEHSLAPLGRRRGS